MACRIPDLTVSELINKIREKQFDNLTSEVKTQEDTIKLLDLVRNIATTAEVDNTKLKKGLYLDRSGKTPRYVDTLTGEVLFSGRTSDAAKESFVRKMGEERAYELSDSADSKIKANSGTKVHKALQDLLEALIEVDDSGFIMKNNYPRDIKSSTEIAAELGFARNSDDFMSLYKLADSIIADVVKLQKKIDPQGKAVIRTEQFLFDTKKDEGGTEDVVVIFSDNSNFIYDYKTMTPKYGTTLENGRKQITAENWIPTYKMEDFQSTLPKHIEKLAKFGSIKNRGARILPIHIEHQQKPTGQIKTGSTITPKISQIVASPLYNPLLSPIPIVKEETGFKSIDESIEKLYVLKNNIEVKLSRVGEENTEREKLNVKLKRVTKMINSVIVDKDLDLLYEEIERLNKIYDIDEILTLSTVDKLEDKRQLLQEIDALLSISANTVNYLNELGFSAEEVETKMKEYSKLIGHLQIIRTPLKEAIAAEVLSSDRLEEAKQSRQLDVWDKTFRSKSEIRDPIFETASDLLDESNNSRRLYMQTFEEKMKSAALELEKWGVENGYRGLSVYKLLTDSKTGNLYSKHTKELYTNISELQKKGDTKGLKKILKLRSDASEKFERNLNIHKKYNPNETQAQLNKWKADNSIENSLLKPREYYKYYEVNEEELDEKFITEGFKKIKSNKALLNYYNFYTKSMEEARNKLGLRGSYWEVPDNFIPWIKADVLDQLFQGNSSYIGLLSSMKDILYVSEDNTTFGEIVDRNEINPADNSVVRQIPKFFVNPLKNTDGKIDSTLKSFDLNKSLFVFMDMATNYNNMSRIQAQIEALKDVIVDEQFGESLVDDKGNFIKDTAGRIRKVFGAASSKRELFNKMINYHLYGVKLQDDFSKNVIQAAQSAKSYQQLIQLGFAPLTQTANYLGAKINSYYTGVKGYSYTSEMLAKSHKMAANYFSDNEEGELYRALTNFFEPYPGSRSRQKASELSSLGQLKGKWVGTELAFAGFRLADENMDNTILLSMMQNYGINDEGNITRLKRLPEGSKSLLERSSVKDGKLIIDGITNISDTEKLKRYTQFRNMVMTTAKSIKGSMNSEDMNAINMNLITNLMMSFKNWMPGLVNERFGATKYNRNLGTITEGRYTAFYNDILDKEDRKLFGFTFGVVVPQIGKLASEIATFGLYKYKVNQERAKNLFEAYKAKYPKNAEIQAMSFEDFLDYKQGQIRALASELRIILMFLGMLSALGGDWDDDGEADYKATQAGRILFRLTNRVRRELVGIINPDDWTNLFRSPLPVSGLLIDLFNWIQNTGDETRDIIMGEDYKGTFKWELDKRDQKNIFYETFQWFPGYKLFIQIFEPREEDKKREV